MSLPLQVENGPSEFALYVVHESGGEYQPLPQIIKTKGRLAHHALSPRAVLACVVGTGQSALLILGPTVPASQMPLLILTRAHLFL